MLSSFDEGLCISFGYPRHNFRGVVSAIEWRRIRITKVRSLDADPLDSTTAPRQPLLARGLTLITGYDFHKRAERSFYLESMTEVRIIDDPATGPQRGYRAKLSEIEDVEFNEDVFECDSLDEIQAWIGEWMKEPIDLAVIVLPPKEASAA